MSDSEKVNWHDEKVLVEGIRSGDPAAFKELVQNLSGRYVQTVERTNGNRQDAEEIVNDAAFKIICKIETYSSLKSKSFWNWSYQIVRNQAIDYYRKQAKKPLQKGIGFDDIPNLDKVLHENAPVLAGLIDSDRECISSKDAALGRGLARLNERDRMIIEGQFFLMLTDEEIGSTLNTNPDNIRKYRSRALKRLHNILVDEPEFANISVSSGKTA